MTNAIRTCICALIIGFTVSTAAAQVAVENSISGKLELDSSWSRVVYLSLITDLKDIYAIGNKSIIDKATLSEDGRFRFKTAYLPEDDALYRIHISKKEDPPITLILGGRDENFVFVIANKSTQIVVSNTGESVLFKDATISGYAPNKALRQITTLATTLDELDLSSAPLKRELISEAFSEKMRLVADTSKNSLVSLFALYQTDFLENQKVNPSFYATYLEKWKNEKSSCFVAFKSQFDLRKDNHALNYLLFALLGVLIGVGLSFFYFKTIKANKKHNSLSVQEVRVYSLLKEGKSNKEISEEFSIGLSTVKSHVSSILSKKKAKSRKELIEIE